MSRETNKGSGKDQDSTKDSVVDFGRAREQKMEEKRRSTERIFFTQVLGIYGVTDHEKMLPIEFIDASDDGISFKVPISAEDAFPKDLKKLAVRLYFSPETYLPIELEIQNFRPHIEDGLKYTRYGASVDKSHQSYEAYQDFVRFLKSYSKHAHKDLGDVTLFYI